MKNELTRGTPAFSRSRGRLHCAAGAALIGAMLIGGAVPAIAATDSTVISPAATAVGLGSGLFAGSDGLASIGDGNTTTAYGNNGIRYNFTGSGIAFVANKSYIDFDLDQPVIPQSVTLAGYWRQAREKGALGNWIVQARNTDTWITLTAPQPLSTASSISVPAGTIAYRHYRLLYVGGATSANGGSGAGAISEIRVSGRDAGVVTSAGHGVGLFSSSDGPTSLGDGNTTSAYSDTGIRYKFSGDSIDFTPGKTLIEFASAAPLVPESVTLSGYWRQSRAGSLGNWILQAKEADGTWTDLTAPVALSVSSNIEIPPVTTAYQYYRLVFIGGSTSANGGTGAGSITEIHVNGTAPSD
ncbi:hypothetical protein [Microbacterium sp. PMB16]|uniref:hypothetical protein n=1 Tax=Microbacterium sp. PMB16 TaxID=3120157 RepID=UPI003F4B3B6F